MKKETYEIVVPVWARETGYAFFGDRDYTGYVDDVGSAHVKLRAICEGDKYPWFSEDVRAINNFTLYVWFSSDGTVCIDVRHEAGGRQQLRELEAAVKMFKRLTAKISKKYSMLNNFSRKSSIHTELTLVLDALGVKRSVIYKGIGTEDTYQPIALAVKPIAEILEKRQASLKKREAA
jgi:hypothetical protein